jgi:hypothetical protein
LVCLRCDQQFQRLSGTVPQPLKNSRVAVAATLLLLQSTASAGQLSLSFLHLI